MIYKFLQKMFIFYFFSLISLIFGDPSRILPCFAPYPIGGGAQPLVAIYYTTLYDCLMSCLSATEGCASVVWDDRQHNCYLYATTATANPAILLNRYGTVYYQRVANDQLAQCGTVPGGVGPPISPGPVIPTNNTGPGLSCPSRSNTAYFVTPGAELPSTVTTSAVVPGLSDENVCISTCTDQMSSANGAAVGCTSFSSARSGNTVQCTFSTASGPPDGGTILKQNPNSFFFQKFCLASGSPATCFEQFFFLLPQTSIAEHTVSTGKSTSIVDCANQCVANPKCKSAVYDAGTNLCILKDATTNTPGGTSANANQYYLENGCLLAQKSTGGGGGAGGRRSLLSRFFQKSQSVKGQGKTFTTTTPEPTLAIFDEFISTEIPQFDTTELIPTEEDDPKSNKIPSELSSWSHWSVCKFNVGGRRSRVRTRNCTNFVKCPDKNIEFEICSS